MKRWGRRKLSDETIRKISSRIKMIPKKGSGAAFEELAREFKCSSATIHRIYAGYLTPKDIEKCQL